MMLRHVAQRLRFHFFGMGLNVSAHPGIDYMTSIV